MNKMEKFKEIRTMYWGIPAEEPSGTHDGGLGVKEKYDAEVSEAGIVDFILDSFSMREAGFIQENMEKGFKMFVRDKGCKPDYAICSVAWNDGDIYPEVNIRLSETVNPAIRDAFLDTDRRFDYGIKGGAGFGFVFDPVEIHFSAMYKYSMSSLYQPDYYSQYYYRYAYPSNIVFSVGLHFQLTKRTGKTRHQLKQEARQQMEVVNSLGTVGK